MFGIFSWMFASKWVMASQHSLGDGIHMDTTFSLCFYMVLNYCFHLLTSKWLLHSSVGMEGDCLSMYFDKNWKESLELSLWIGPRRQEVEVRTASCMGGISAGACAAQYTHKWSVKAGEARLQAHSCFVVIKIKATYGKLQNAFEIMRVHKM